MILVGAIETPVAYRSRDAVYAYVAAATMLVFFVRAIHAICDGAAEHSMFFIHSAVFVMLVRALETPELKDKGQDGG